MMWIKILVFIWYPSLIAAAWILGWLRGHKSGMDYVKNVQLRNAQSRAATHVDQFDHETHDGWGLINVGHDWRT